MEAECFYHWSYKAQAIQIVLLGYRKEYQEKNIRNWKSINQTDPNERNLKKKKRNTSNNIDKNCQRVKANNRKV